MWPQRPASPEPLERPLAPGASPEPSCRAPHERQRSPMTTVHNTLAKLLIAVNLPDEAGAERSRDLGQIYTRDNFT